MSGPPPGIKCQGCGREVKSELVFLCGSTTWVPFCSHCLYQSKNRMAVAIAATGMGEAKLAKSLKVSPSTIRSWRAGRVKNPKKENLEKLASLAGVTVDWLEGQEEGTSG